MCQWNMTQPVSVVRIEAINQLPGICGIEMGLCMDTHSDHLALTYKEWYVSMKWLYIRLYHNRSVLVIMYK